MQDLVARFLNDLTPEDVGFLDLGRIVIRYEGFTDACWEEAMSSSKTIDELEKVILEDWSERTETRGLVVGECGWWTESIFFAVYLHSR